MIQIQQLIAIVKEASKRMIVDHFSVMEKGGCENIVTSSDLAVQYYLCERLSEELPGCGFLCEEEDQWTVAPTYTWIIDPIDGTANYSRGIQHCAICVGLREGDQMIMSVVYLPRTNELFHAERGKGAFLNGQPIHVSQRTFDVTGKTKIFDAVDLKVCLNGIIFRSEADNLVSKSAVNIHGILLVKNGVVRRKL